MLLQEDVQHQRRIEQQIYHESMSSMRNIVESEMKDMHEMLVTAGAISPVDSSDGDSVATGGGESLAPIVEEDDEDLFDVESLSLRPLEMLPAIPLHYLLDSSPDGQQVQPISQ